MFSGGAPNQRSTIAERSGAITDIAHTLRRPLRRVAVLRVVIATGRRLSFTELRPATALAIVRQVHAARTAALGAGAAS